jgi:hypothetical protein
VCPVAAPSKLTRPVGNRVKTDFKEAEHLCRPNGGVWGADTISGMIPQLITGGLSAPDMMIDTAAVNPVSQSTTSGPRNANCSCTTSTAAASSR